MNHPRRVRSPPFGYNPRVMNMVDARPPPPGPDYDDPYAQGPPFESPIQAGPAFIEPHPQYPCYREHPLPSNFRNPMREQYPPTGSAPYKILCITNINPKVGDGPVKEALIGDFSRFGDISVSICHDSGERLAYIYFRTYEEAREARHAKSRTILFDRPIEIEPIYEPRMSPVDSPPPPPMNAPPQIYPRRRSITPPDVYYDMNGPMPHELQRPQAIPSPLAHQHGMSPPNYHHPSRYPIGPEPLSPTMPTRQDPYGRYNVPTSHLAPQGSPYPPLSRDPKFRSSRTHPESFMPAAYPPYQHPPYIPPPMARERERIVSEGHISRGMVPDPYYPIEHHRGYPQPQPPPPPPQPTHSSRSVYSNPNHHHSGVPQHGQQSTSSNYHSSPHPEPPRFTSRDHRREKFESYNTNNHDESRPSRVLIVNNVDANKTEFDVRDVFEPFGIIEDVEVRKIGPEIMSALIKFSSMDAAYKAKTATNGRYIGSLRCRIIYGKVNASRRLWIGGISPSLTFSGLEDEVSKYGEITNLDYTSGRPYAYVEYESANQAQFAAHHLRGILVAAAERKIRIEFVDSDRGEKAITKHGSSLQVSDISSRSRTTNESWSTNDQEPSPQSNRKRSLSPNDSTAKRVCQLNDSTQDSDNFKLESNSSNSVLLKKAISPPNAHSDDKSLAEDNELNNNQDHKVQTDILADIALPVDDMPQPENDELDRIALCTSVQEITQCCPVFWNGHLVLRNFDFPSKITMCSGEKSTIEKYLTRTNGEKGDQCPILRITQRWRLHPQPKLEDVKRRMRTGNTGMLIITSKQDQSPMSSQSPPSDSMPSAAGQKLNGNTSKDMSVDDAKSTPTETISATEGGSVCQARPLKNLISYLEQKDAAGVISLGCSKDVGDKDHADGSKLLYAFPPGDFALSLLKRLAPKLALESTREEFLLGIIAGGIEGRA